MSLICRGGAIMIKNYYLSRLIAAGGILSLPILCAMQGQQSIIIGHYVMANNHLTQINIDYQTGTLEDPTWEITQQKIKEAADLRLNELNVVIPDNIIEITEAVGLEYDICPELLQAIIWQESRCIANVYNSSCKGLMQVNIKVKTNRDNITELAAEKNLDYWSAVFDPEINIETGAKLLRVLFDSYGDDPAEILMRYNGDSSNLKTYLNGGSMSEYAEKTLEISELLERSHNK